MRRLVVLGLIAAACGGGPSAEVATTPDSTTVEVIDVLVERGADESFTAAVTGDQLAEGDVVRTDPVGFASIAYVDGSLARLGPSSSLTIVALAESGEPVGTRVDLDAGRLWNRVEGVTESEGRYEVGTPVGVAAVRGTVFDVDCQPDRCTFTVLEGVVEVELPDGSTVRLEAGQRLQIVAGAAPGDPEPFPAEGAGPDPWIEGNQLRDLQRDAQAGGAQTAGVEAARNIWLAGMPDGTETAGDRVPEHAPQLVAGVDLSPGTELTFIATGAVSFGGGTPSGTPDGSGAGSHATEFGIAGINAPWDSLIGVFLGDEQPDATAEPATLDFTTELADYDVLTPALKQPFFIGDGLRADGTPHRVVVPDGATRLYLGSVDGYGWYNNTGSFTVTIVTN